MAEEDSGTVSTVEEGEGTVRVGRVESEIGSCEGPTPVGCVFVIFGASGDLTRRKLIPSLYRLEKAGLLRDGFMVVGTARSELTSDGFREEMKNAVKSSEKDFDRKTWKRFARALHYIPTDFSDPASFGELRRFIEAREAESDCTGNRLFYLAIPPRVYAPVIENLAAAGLSGEKDEKGCWTNLVVEKPYGSDLESARDLDRVAHRHFREEQIYRIDHYLGKETVQNILMLRFANAIFEPIWNRRYVDHVQITVAESLGIEKRAGYYEQSGVIRDMFQNHMLQVLSLITMEPPSLMYSELVRDERVKVMRALRPLDIRDHGRSVVVGQYGPGTVDGEDVGGYLDEKGVSPDSATPTYAAMRLFVDNWRWQGVPFYLRSGKRLASRYSEVVIHFKPVPHRLFEETMTAEVGPNALVLRIQPDERVQLRFHTKHPGARMCLRDVLMDFPYLQGYTGISFDAYERVLLDCMAGEKTLFVRTDGIELSWAFLTPLLEALERGTAESPPLGLYEPGSWGPGAADELIRKDGRRWYNYEGR